MCEVVLMTNKIQISDVQRAVADRYHITVADLIGPVRSMPLARYRQLAYWLCRQHTTASFPKIAKAFGRDHTTVIHGCLVVDELLFPELRHDIHLIERSLELDSTTEFRALVATVG